MCEALGGSCSEFYAWLTCPRIIRSLSHVALRANVYQSFVGSDRTDRARRVWHAILESGCRCRLHRIGRLMREQALRARPRRRGLPGYGTLARHGYQHRAELRRTPPKYIRSHFGVVMERTAQELRDVSCLDMVEVAPARKAICCSRSFGCMVTSIEAMTASVTKHIAHVAEKPRRPRSMCRVVSTLIQTNCFRLKRIPCS